MDGYEREMVYRAGRNPVLDAAQDRADAIADAWANAPQKAFEDDYTAFVGWAESTLAPILVAALVAERALADDLGKALTNVRERNRYGMGNYQFWGETDLALAAWRVARA